MREQSLSDGESRTLQSMREFATINRVPTIRELAERVGCGVSTAYYFVNKLAEKGLVQHGLDRSYGGYSTPVPLVMFCPHGHQHVDVGETAERPHVTHQCHRTDHKSGTTCGARWTPARFATVGVEGD